MNTNLIKPHYFYSSLTRISDLKSQPFGVRLLPKEEWSTGDYVVGEVLSPVSVNSKVELPDGRLASLLPGDHIIGAFGVRRATYNGSVVLEELKGYICYTVLCASDPYSVVGVCQGFGFKPDLITGIATSTSSGVELVEKLTGIQALTLSEPDTLPVLTQLLKDNLWSDINSRKTYATPT